MIIINFGVEQTVIYTNWEGKTAKRRIIPLRLEKKELVLTLVGPGQSGKPVLPHGPGEKWCLEVFDLDKQVMRSFLLNGIKGVVFV